MRKYFFIVILIYMAFSLFGTEPDETAYILPFIAKNESDKSNAEAIRNAFIKELKKSELFKLIVSEDVLKELDIPEFKNYDNSENQRKKIHNRLKPDLIISGSIYEYDAKYFEIALFNAVTGHEKISYIRSGYDTESGRKSYISNMIDLLGKERNRIMSNKPSEGIAFVKKEDYDSSKNYPGEIFLISKSNNLPGNITFQAPPSELTDVTNGNNYSLKDFKGKMVVMGIFEKKHEMHWEPALLDKILKIFPDNVKVILGVDNPDKEWIDCNLKNGCDFPVVNIAGFMKSIPGNLKENIINNNLIITEDGIVSGYFNETSSFNFSGNGNHVSDWSTQTKIEYILRPYFNDNMNVKSNRIPCSIVEAVERNDMEEFKKALIRDKDINAYEGNENALYYSLRNGNIDMLKILVENKAGLNDYFYNYGLEDASRNDNFEMVKYIISIIDKNNPESKEYAVTRSLEQAFENDNSSVVKYLLDNGADPVYALSYSAKKDKMLDLTKYLIQKKLKEPACLFYSTSSNGTPYQISKKYNQIKTMNYLESVLKDPGKGYESLVVLAKDEIDYKDILAGGYKPKLPPDYKFPASQQTGYDCAYYSIKHLVQYKYDVVLDIEKIKARYGLEKYGFKEYAYCMTANTFFYFLITGEPVIVGYNYHFKDGSSMWHYVVAYSFDQNGIWISDSAGAKRWRIDYDRFISMDGYQGYPFQGTIVGTIK